MCTQWPRGLFTHIILSLFQKHTRIIIFCSFHKLSCCQQREAVCVKVFLVCLQHQICAGKRLGDLLICNHAVMKEDYVLFSMPQAAGDTSSSVSQQTRSSTTNYTHTLVNLFESCCSKRSSTCSVCWTCRSDRLTRARCSFSADRFSFCWFLHTFSEITDSCLQMLFKRSCVRMLEGKLKQEQVELIVSLSGKRKDLKRSWNEAEWHVEMDL